MNLIIRVDPRRTVQTCIRLADLCGQQVIPIDYDPCGRPTLDAYVIVNRAGCKPVAPPKRIWCGCSYREEPVPDPEPSGVRYAAWEMDDEGRVCFYWDNLLLDSPPGRYDAVIHVKDKPVAQFQIDLRHRIHITEVLNKQHASAC